MLGNDEAKVQEVDSQTLKAFAKAAGGEEATAFTLKPEPQNDDAPDKTSQFVGELPTDLQGRSLEVTIPGIRIAGRRDGGLGDLYRRAGQCAERLLGGKL
jgi:hypothetical protein